MSEKELKYAHVLNESGMIVSADKLTKEDKLASKYYILGFNKNTGERLKEQVYLVAGTKKRNHFKRFPDKSKLRNKEFVCNRREYNELIVHQLTKQIFKSGRLATLCLPACKSTLSGESIPLMNERLFSINKVILEARIDIPEDTPIIADVLVENSNGNKLIIEIFATHSVDKIKADKIKKIGMDAIEIDISSLINDNDTINLEEKIIELILKQYSSHIKWITNYRLQQFENWINGQVYFKIFETQHNKQRDGMWYIWATDSLDRLVNCPYTSEIILSKGQKTGWLGELGHCSTCKRAHIEYDSYGNPTLLKCNQSSIDDVKLLEWITNINKDT